MGADETTIANELKCSKSTVLKILKKAIAPQVDYKTEKILPKSNLNKEILNEKKDDTVPNYTTINVIIKLSKEGYSIQAIARMVNVSEVVVENVLKIKLDK